MTLFWVDPQGVLIKATDDDSVVEGATAVTTPPDNPEHQTWDSVAGAWVDNSDRAAKEQRSADLAVLRTAGEDLALVLTELIEYLLANTAMEKTNFTALVRQKYLDLKAIADRVKI